MTSNQISNDHNKIARRQTQINQQLADQDLRKTQALEKQARVAVATAPAQYLKAAGSFMKKPQVVEKRSVFYQPHNGIEWYTNELNATSVVSNLSFNQPYGTSLNITPKMGNLSNDGLIPAALSVKFVPWIGTTNVLVQEDPDERSSITKDEYIDQFSNSAINLAAYNMYAFVRYANSGNRNYEKGDMAGFLLSAATIYPALATLYRALRILRTFKFKNRVYGRFLWKAAGFTEDRFDTDCNNFNDYVARFNVLLMKANVLRVPKDLAVMQKWVWLTSNIFKDDDYDGVKGQLIVPVMAALYDLDPSESYITVNPIQYDSVTNISTLFDKINTAISHLTQSESFAIMMGDILKAYGEDKLIKLETISIDEIQPIEAEYDAEMFQQLSNASLVTFKHQEGTISQILTTGWDNIFIRQDDRDAVKNTGNLYPSSNATRDQDYYHRGAITPIVCEYPHESSFPTWLRDHIFSTLHNPILNATNDSPSSEDVIYMTRFKMSGGYYLMFEDDKINRVQFHTDSCGTELICKVESVDMPTDSTMYGSVTQVYGYNVIDATQTAQWGNALLDIVDYLSIYSGAATYNILPRMYFLLRTIDTSRIHWFSFGRWENPINFSSITLDKIHTPCVYSELTVPGATGLSNKPTVSAKSYSRKR